jgi:hypothetical protein
MSQGDLLFLVVTLILVTTITITVVNLVRGRRGGDAGDGRAGWWEGPWEDDDRRR